MTRSVVLFLSVTFGLIAALTLPGCGLLFGFKDYTFNNLKKSDIENHRCRESDSACPYSAEGAGTHFACCETNHCCLAKGEVCPDSLVGEECAEPLPADSEW